MKMRIEESREYMKYLDEALYEYSRTDFYPFPASFNYHIGMSLLFISFPVLASRHHPYRRFLLREHKYRSKVRND